MAPVPPPLIGHVLRHKGCSEMLLSEDYWGKDKQEDDATK